MITIISFAVDPHMLQINDISFTLDLLHLLINTLKKEKTAGLIHTQNKGSFSMG